MKHRAIGAVLFGIGVLLLVFAAGVAFVVTPSLKKLPYDLLPSESVAEAPGAEFLHVKSGGDLGIYQGTLRATTAVQINKKETADLTGDLDSSAVVWTVGQTVERLDTKEKVSQYAAELAIDRASGAGLPTWEGRWYDEAEAKEKVDFQGQVYKFPFSTEKKDYLVYDRDLRKALPAQYKGAENVGGIEAYRFEQVITDQELNLAPNRVKLLLGKFAPEATTGKVIYSNTRTVWVDPVTGSYLNVKEAQRKVLVPDAGSRTTLLNADFAYTQDTIDDSVKRAKDSRMQLNAIGVYFPAALAIFGLLAIAGGLLVVRRGNRLAPVTGEARHRADSVSAAEQTATRVDDEPVRGTAPAKAERVEDEPAPVEQLAAERKGGPLSDEIPPASRNWREEEKAVPAQRPAAEEDETGKR